MLIRMSLVIAGMRILASVRASLDARLSAVLAAPAIVVNEDAGARIIGIARVRLCSGVQQIAHLVQQIALHGTFRDRDWLVQHLVPLSVCV